LEQRGYRKILSEVSRIKGNGKRIFQGPPDKGRVDERSSADHVIGKGVMRKF
jgi:hypothetical protein